MSEYHFRPAEAHEARLLRPLWRDGFGDTEAFMACYEARMFRPDRIELAMLGDEATAMLTVIPAVLRMADGTAVPSGCVYGVATRRQYRRQGIATRILETAVRRRLGHSMDCIAVVPDTPSLFPYYGRAMNASTAFYLRTVQATAELLCAHPALRPEAVRAEDYGPVREAGLRGRTHMEWDLEALAFQEEICREDRGGLFLFPDAPGCCAAVARREDGSLLVYELLAPEDLLAACLGGLLDEMSAKVAEVRLPAWSGASLSGAIEPFAMLAGRTLPPAMQAYLGFDFA